VVLAAHAVDDAIVLLLLLRTDLAEHLGGADLAPQLGHGEVLLEARLGAVEDAAFTFAEQALA
jgi:hypothetical protein